MQTLEDLTVDRFVRLKDAIEESVTDILQSKGYDAFATVDEVTNDPKNVREGSVLVLRLVLEDN